MNLRFLVKLNAILGGVMLFALPGCDRKTVVSERLDKEESAQTGTILKPAEPNSFEEVSARLDRGGSLYFYISGLMDTSPPATILLEDKFAPREHQRVVCHVDGSVEIAAAQ